MIFAIVAAILGYRKAKDSGRNGWLWAFIATATFIGTQFVTALVLGIAFGLYLVSSGRSENEIASFELVITIIAVVLSLAATWGVLKFLDRVPPSDNYSQPPPPPTNFN
jgi:4-amino-4-deoxy-L-arabinose transferase-like glycosyltransferase